MFSKLFCCCQTCWTCSYNANTLFLFIFDRSRKASFGVCFSKNWKNWTLKIFGGPRALGENRKILNFFIFLLTNPTFSSSIWIVHVLSFHLRCITPLKLKILKSLNFFTIISIEICHPLATKQRDLKMFKMASQVVFRPKNVPRFSFGLLVAPKPKNQGGGP